MLKDYQDAHGHMWWDALHGGPGVEIAERDDGFIDASVFSGFYLADFKDWPGYERKAMKYARGRVLDVGCGAGRHAIYLQGKGLNVLGTDISGLALKVSKKRGLKKTRLIGVTGITSQLGRFDTILMLGNNFGLFGNCKRAKRILGRFHVMTSDKGRIIAATLDPYKTDLPEHLAYHRRNRKRGRMAGQVRIRVRYKKYATPWFDYLFVSKREMKEILDGTGWVARKFIDSKGPGYIAVIEKLKRGIKGMKG